AVHRQANDRRVQEAGGHVGGMVGTPALGRRIRRPKRGPYAALSLPPATRARNRSLSVPPVTRTREPSGISPARILSASGSCTSRWITRFSGRAPYTGS